MRGKGGSLPQPASLSGFDVKLSNKNALKYRFTQEKTISMEENKKSRVDNEQSV